MAYLYNYDTRDDFMDACDNGSLRSSLMACFAELHSNHDDNWLNSIRSNDYVVGYFDLEFEDDFDSHFNTYGSDAMWHYATNCIARTWVDLILEVRDAYVAQLDYDPIVDGLKFVTITGRLGSMTVYRSACYQQEAFLMVNQLRALGCTDISCDFEVLDSLPKTYGDVYRHD